MKRPTRLALMTWMALLTLLAYLPATTLAADDPMARRADPWVPPAARIRSTEPPTEGAALQAQVTDKLRRRFDAADPQRYGSITRTQAQRAGLGFVSQHFDRIDSRRSGSVTFDELRAYLSNRVANR